MEELIDKARNSLGPFCMHTCKALCCRRGQLLLEYEESLVIDTTFIPDANNQVTVPLADGCPKLGVDFSCTVYENRPSACRQYPLYPKKNLLLVATSCQGFKEGLLDEYLKQLKQAGFRIEYI